MRKSSTVPPFLVIRRRKRFLKRKYRPSKNQSTARKARKERFARLSGVRELPEQVLRAPEYFALLRPKSHKALIGFLRKLVKLTLVDQRLVCIDFRPTKKFYSDGTLLFYAELQRILLRRPRSVRCYPPLDEVACQVLDHLKIFQFLGSKKKAPSQRDDVIHWEVFQGIEVDFSLGPGPALDQLPGLDQSQRSKLHKSLSEASVNVTQHAYEGSPRQDGTGLESERGWWMFVRREPDKLSISCADLGLGVPYTVPRDRKNSKWLSARLENFNEFLQVIGVRKHNDGQIIRATIDEKRSRFQQTHRGNGFGNIVESIADSDDGSLIVYSNQGAYFLRKTSDSKAEKTFNYNESIFGTMICWTISITE
jgi:hypothetical protein